MPSNGVTFHKYHTNHMSALAKPLLEMFFHLKKAIARRSDEV